MKLTHQQPHFNKEYNPHYWKYTFLSKSVVTKKSVDVQPKMYCCLKIKWTDQIKKFKLTINPYEFIDKQKIQMIYQ